MIQSRRLLRSYTEKALRNLSLPYNRALFSSQATPGFVSQVEYKTNKDRMLKVALVGRPNVGKSTLFNRLTKSNKAIVSNIPGTTRDRKESRGYLAGIPFTVIDTGGLEDGGGELNQLIQQQVERAILSCDAIIFMIDGREGINATDQNYARWLRNKIYRTLSSPDYKPPKILLAINKTEGARLNDFVLDVVAESTRLGFGEPLLLSGAHGDGIAELASSLVEIIRERGLLEEDPDDDKKKSSTTISSKTKAKHNRTPTISSLPSPQVDEESDQSIDDDDQSLDDEGDDAEIPEEDDEEDIGSYEIAEIEKEVSANNNFEELKNKTIQVAIMGRPNVGKSTLLNAIIGENRVIAGPLPGLTRDSIEVEWTYQDRQFRLVDTAGLTRIHTNKQLLSDIKVKAHQSVSNVLKQSVKEARVRLPGKEMIEHIDDVPSQFSEQISEYALMSAFHALRFAQVVILVVESLQGKFLKLDLQLAQKCLEEGRCVMIVANKADLVLSRGISLNLYENQVEQHVSEAIRELGKVPIIACSAINNIGIDKILTTVIDLHDTYSKRIPTWILNRWMKELMVTAPTARLGTKAVRIKYITQVKVRPPSFLLFSNVVNLPPFVEKFFKTRLQSEFALAGIPLRLEVKKTKGNPVKMHLLKQGKHTRRGTGLGESRGKVGKDRKLHRQIQQRREKVDERRRRDTRLRRNRKT
eukprot:gene8840-9575_t